MDPIKQTVNPKHEDDTPKNLLALAQSLNLDNESLNEEVNGCFLNDVEAETDKASDTEPSSTRR